MERSKCPECGVLLRYRKGKCRSCGADISVCPECSTIYVKGVECCDMCGRELKRRRKRQEIAPRSDDLSPNDLVSVINEIKQKNIAYKILRIGRGVLAALFSILLVISVMIGLMCGDLLTDVAILGVEGANMTQIGEYVSNTPARNMRLWTAFVSELSKSPSTVSVLLGALNYFVSAMILPVLVVTVGYCAIYLPLEIAEKIWCGIAVKKKGYNASDTVAIFERPTLVYNSSDSFRKAYIYFPFIQRVQGCVGAVIADILLHSADVFYCVFALFVLSIHTVIKIIMRIILADVGEVIEYSIPWITLGIVMIYVFSVAIVCASVIMIVNAIRKKQLGIWSDKI